MRVRVLKGADKGKIRDMGTMAARAQLRLGNVELVAQDVCPRDGGLYVEVATLKAEPARFECSVCGAARVEKSPEAEPEPEPKPRRGRRSRGSEE